MEFRKLKSGYEVKETTSLLDDNGEQKYPDDIMSSISIIDYKNKHKIMSPISYDINDDNKKLNCPQCLNNRESTPATLFLSKYNGHDFIWYVYDSINRHIFIYPCLLCDD